MRQLDEDVWEVIRAKDGTISQQDVCKEVRKIRHRRQNLSFWGIWFPRTRFEIRAPTLDEVNEATRRLQKQHPDLKRHRRGARGTIAGYEHTA